MFFDYSMAWVPLDRIQNSVYACVLQAPFKQSIACNLTDLERKDNKNFTPRPAWRPGVEKL
jgi:CRISPR/Cas system-associated endoribonuclease Cas2